MTHPASPRFTGYAQPYDQPPAEQPGVGGFAPVTLVTSPASDSPTASAAPMFSSVASAQPSTQPLTRTPAHLAAAPSSVRKEKQKLGRGAIAAIVTLALLTVAALGLGTYFWFAADRWTANAAAWEDHAHTHAASVSELNGQLEVARAELNALQQQLESAQTRITELANERAQLGDQQVVDQNRIDFQARLSTAAAQVASSLDLCITRQDELIEALRNPGRYTEESVANFTHQVAQFCADARTANANLQSEINR